MSARGALPGSRGLLGVGYFHFRQRDLAAFFSSCAYIVGTLASAAISLYPFSLPWTCRTCLTSRLSSCFVESSFTSGFPKASAALSTGVLFPSN